MVIFHSYVKLPEGNHHAKPMGVLGETVFSDDKPIYLRSTFIFEIRWWFGNAFSNETSIDWLQGQSTYRNHGLYGQVLIFSAPFFIQQAILGGRYLKLCLYGLNMFPIDSSKIRLSSWNPGIARLHFPGFDADHWTLGRLWRWRLRGRLRWRLWLRWRLRLWWQLRCWLW